MDILVVENVMGARIPVARWISGAGHRARRARLGRDALELARARPPELVIADASLEDCSGIDLVKRMKHLPRGKPYAILCAPAWSASELAGAVDAGADDCIVTSIGQDELLVRVDVAGRVMRQRREASAVHRATRSLPLVAQLPRRAAATGVKPALFSPAPSIANTRAWAALETTVGLAISGMIGRSFGSAPSSSSPASEALCSFLGMSDAVRQQDLGIAVHGSRVSLSAISEQLLGEPAFDDPIMLDLAGELANLIGGALKGALLPEGWCLTSRTPRTVDVSRLGALAARYDTAVTFAFRSGHIEVGVVVATGARTNLRVKSRSLEEDMVVAKEVRDASGVVLVKAGVRLTASLIARVVQNAPNIIVTVSTAIHDQEG